MVQASPNTMSQSIDTSRVAKKEKWLLETQKIIIDQGI